MHEISPLLISAVLLAQFVIAQHIGLRTISSLREAIGVSATILITTPIAVLIDWLLLHTVLQPFDIVYLHLFIGIILTSAIASISESLLRIRFAQWFPPLGNLSPLTMTTCCTLIAAHITRADDAAFISTIFSAIGLSFGAVFLLLAMQTLRERKELKPSLLINSLVNDILHGAFILVALRGVLSIWR